MYTHARQFPHLAGMDDRQIREVAREAMAKRPLYQLMMRLRNVVVLASMGVAVLVLVWFAEYSLGSALLMVGAIGTAATLIWNLVSVNTVLFRITYEELGRP